MQKRALILAERKHFLRRYFSRDINTFNCIMASLSDHTACKITRHRQSYLAAIFFFFFNLCKANVYSAAFYYNFTGSKRNGYECLEQQIFVALV